MKEELKEFGLTEGESKVYIALLKLGSSTVGPIVKESGVSYSKIYEVLGRLIEKGIVSFNIKEKTKYFQAVSPNKLKNYLVNEEEKLNKKKQILNKLIPQLEGINKRIEQKAEIFIGINGLKTAYGLLLKEKSKENILRFFYVHNEEYSEITDEFYEKEFLNFKENKIKLQGIANLELKKSKSFSKPPKFVELRFVDFPLPSTIDIYNDKVLIVTWKDKPYAYLISSKEIYENYFKYFEQV